MLIYISCKSKILSYMMIFLILPLYRGTEEGFWKDKAVVIAKVVDHEELVNDRGNARLELKGIICTDMYIQTDIGNISFSNGKTSALDFHPIVGKEYVILIEKHDNTWIIPRDYFTFFDSNSAVDQFEGFTDQKFKDLTHRIANIRQKSR